MWIPNFLTGLRICTAVAFPLVPQELRISLAVFSLLTEFLDGKIARMFYWQTALGKILDPIADKLFAFAGGITVLASGKLELWEFLFLVTRDLLVTAGFLGAVFLSTRLLEETEPNFIGKLTTALQYAVFIYLLVLGRPPEWAIYTVGACSAVSGIVYLVTFRRKIHETA
jgi:cardiolipin synthase